MFDGQLKIHVLLNKKGLADVLSHRVHSNELEHSSQFPVHKLQVKLNLNVPKGHEFIHIFWLIKSKEGLMQDKHWFGNVPKHLSQPI